MKLVISNIALRTRQSAASIFLGSFVLFAAVMAASCGDSATDSGQEKLLCSLDSVARCHNDLIAHKDSVIRRLAIAVPADDSGRFDAYDRLYSEYYSYNLDSAAHYAGLKIDMAQRLGDRSKRAVSYLNMARICFALGDESEAMSAVAQAVGDTVLPEVAASYYDVMDAYAEMKGRGRLPWLRGLTERLDTGSSHWIYSQSNLLKEKGDVVGAMKVLETNDSLLLSSQRLVALTNYLKSRLSLEMGDTALAVKQLTASAINDLSTPVRDYKSLYELAALLLKQGDTERAYRYINLAVEDIKSSKVIDNIMAVNEIMPGIVAAREDEMRREKMIYTWFSVGLVLMSALLAAALGMARRANRIAKAAAANEKSLNAELHEANSSLNVANERLRESNRVKDAYLVQYFNLCSYYVGRFEKFRGSVSAAARSKGLAGVEAVIAKTDDRELRNFYTNFDDTFLKLFPGFIDGLNALLLPERRMALNRDGSMSNELRVMALIRLGVSDSEQIAGFLRRSVSTIYNYRVKMRNAAVCPRDEFENRLRSIPQ